MKVDWNPPCPDCGQPLGVDTYAAYDNLRNGGPYPDDSDWYEDAPGHIAPIFVPEVPAEFFGDAADHWLRHHAGGRD